MAHQGHPLHRLVVRRPPQPDAGDDVRLLHHLGQVIGAGLGTVGFSTGVAEAMVRDAGFTQFTVHDFDDPANLYYEVRP